MSSFRQPVGSPLPNWTPAREIPKSEITGRYCRISPLIVAKHSADLFASFSKDREGSLWTYLPYGPFQDFNEYQKWLGEISRNPDPFFYTLFDLKSEKAIGVFALMRIDQSVGSIEIGHVAFSPELKRTRLATEAVFLAMQAVFQRGYRRFEWKCDSLNEASNKAALRFGFQFEGCFRQDRVYKKRSRDTNWYSIIDREWPSLEAEYQRWLNPENFNNDGQQITVLDTKFL